MTYRIAFALKKRLLQCEASAFHDLQLLAAARSCAKKIPAQAELDRDTLESRGGREGWASKTASIRIVPDGARQPGRRR